MVEKYDLDDLSAMWIKDAEIEHLALDKEALKIPKLQAKWGKIFKDCSVRAKLCESKYTKFRQLKWKYYSGKLSKDELDELGWQPMALKYNLREDIERALETDNDLIDLGLKKFLLEEQTEFCKLVIKELQSRNWTIRAAIDFMKYNAGG